MSEPQFPSKQEDLITLTRGLPLTHKQRWTKAQCDDILEAQCQCGIFPP